MTKKSDIKQRVTDAQDMNVKWVADFEKMTLDIVSEHDNGLVSPVFLLNLLEGLHILEDHFERIQITGAIEITRQFRVRLTMRSGSEFEIRAYRQSYPDNSSIELEFFEIKTMQGIICPTSMMKAAGIDPDCKYLHGSVRNGELVMSGVGNVSEKTRAAMDRLFAQHEYVLLKLVDLD